MASESSRLSTLQIGEFLRSNKDGLVAAALEALPECGADDVASLAPFVFALRDGGRNGSLYELNALTLCGTKCIPAVLGYLRPGATGPETLLALQAVRSVLFYDRHGSADEKLNLQNAEALFAYGDVENIVRGVLHSDEHIRMNAAFVLSSPVFRSKLKEPGARELANQLFDTMLLWLTDGTSGETWFGVASTLLASHAEISIEYLLRALEEPNSITSAVPGNSSEDSARIVANRAARIVNAIRELPANADQLIPALINCVRDQIGHGKTSPCQALASFGPRLSGHLAEVSSLLDETSAYEGGLLAQSIIECGALAVQQYLLPRAGAPYGETFLDSMFKSALEKPDDFAILIPDLLPLLDFEAEAIAFRAAHVLVLIGMTDQGSADLLAKLQAKTSQLRDAVVDTDMRSPSKALSLAVHLLTIDALEQRKPELLRCIRKAVRLDRRAA